MLVRVLLYGYAIGLRSSRAIEKATCDNLAFRHLSADQHPDHDSIANFRPQHLTALAALFGQALQLCRCAGLVKLGMLDVDGTKVQASGHKSMRLSRIGKEEQRLQAVIEELLRQAAQTDAEEDAGWGKGQPADPLPADLADAKRRLERLGEAKRFLEQRRPSRLPETQARAASGRNSSSRGTTSRTEEEKASLATHAPRRAVAGETRHYNFTDPDARMVRDGATRHVVQGYNAQIAIDGHAQIILVASVTQQATDSRQLVPLAQAAQTAVQAIPNNIVADAGYWNYTHLTHPVFSATNLLVPPDEQAASKTQGSARTIR